MTTPLQAVLLLAHGTPDKPEDVPAYMRNVTSGREIPDAVMEEVKHRYGIIGRSPLTDITLQQAAGLSKQLSLPVYVGMRNWKPYIADTVNEMVRAGISHAVVICLAPQNSRTSVGLYRRAVLGAAGTSLAFDFVDSWHDHPMLINAFAQKLRTALTRAEAKANSPLAVIFTAHSVPERTIADGDPYSAQAQETAALVAKQVSEMGMGMPEWRFAFQSQGMSGGTWIGPTVEATIDALRDNKAVLVQPVGFVCDHVEVLYDIDILFKRYAAERGVKLFRAESLNTSPEFIDALAALARSRVGAQSSTSAIRAS